MTFDTLKTIGIATYRDLSEILVTFETLKTIDIATHKDLDKDMTLFVNLRDFFHISYSSEPDCSG